MMNNSYKSRNNPLKLMVSYYEVIVVYLVAKSSTLHCEFICNYSAFSKYMYGMLLRCACTEVIELLNKAFIYSITTYSLHEPQ